MNMKRLLIICAIVIAALLVAACEKDSAPGRENLFIEVPDYDDDYVYMIKLLEPEEHAGSGKNIFRKDLPIREIGGCKFYAIRAPRKEYDVYIETKITSIWVDYVNDRKRVNLKVNDWAKLYFTGTKTSKYEVLDGSGEVY